MNKNFAPPGRKIQKHMDACKVERKKSHLPCAGIILFRFYGYYLSLTASWRFSTPGTCEKPDFPVISTANIQ